MIARISEDDFTGLAAAWGIEFPPEEAQQLSAVAGDLLAMLDGLIDDPPVQDPPLAAAREVVEPDGEDLDPLNAIRRHVRVVADEPGSELAGVRLAVKDSIGVAGIPLTLGSAAVAGLVPKQDAVVVDRVLRAGAEIVALTTMDDFAFSGGGDSCASGPTLNPYDRTRTAAGSSSGSAAALHYSYVDASLGTDQGGSIRAPASWCGVLGLKPTHGLVPYTGIVGIDPTFDHVGPMARTTTDLARLLAVIAGPDPGDPRQRGLSAPEDYVGAVADAPGDLSGVSIGIVSEAFGEGMGTQPEVSSAVNAAVERLEQLGAAARIVSLPEHEGAGPLAFASFIEGMTATMNGGGNGFHWKGRYWPELADALAEALRDRPGQLSPQIKVTLVVGMHLMREHRGGVYARAQAARDGLTAAYDRALDGVDCLLMPTTPGLPHVVDDQLSLYDKLMRGWSLLANTIPTDMTGHPALSIPAAEAQGLPVGTMLIGRHHQDAALLRIARTYERSYPWLPSTGQTVGI